MKERPQSHDFPEEGECGLGAWALGSGCLRSNPSSPTCSCVTLGRLHDLSVPHPLVCEVSEQALRTVPGLQ